MIQTPNNKKYSRYQGDEDYLIKAVAKYLDTMNIIWFHCPNEMIRKVQYQQKANRMGRKSGVPDVMILNRCNGYYGLAIELKVKKNTPTGSQLEWLEKLDKLGWKTAWTNGLDEALDIVEDYLSEKRPEFPENRKSNTLWG